jgi:cyclohexyl-isocyanide hydratase
MIDYCHCSHSRRPCDSAYNSCTSPGELTMSLQAPFVVGMLLYPKFTLLDLAGPQSALGLHGTTLLLSKTPDPVPTDSGVSLNPTTLFADCPRDLDVLFVPGGFGTNEAMKDQETVAFLARVGATARYVTSVCSGSLLLGVAGLLDGYRAATHWACYEALEATGAEAARARVVVDRNRITGGGVTAGIDFGLTLLAGLRDEQTAKMTQLAMEYDPEPPYDTGTPTAAGPVLTAMVLAMLGDLNREAVEIAFARRSARAA